MSTRTSFLDATGPVPVRMTNDCLFKMLLQRNERVLRSLICALLHLRQEQISQLEICNPIIPGEAVQDKEIILDVNVLFNDRSVVDLEIQVVDEHNWPERSLYYACRNFTTLTKGGSYDEVRTSIQIGLLDFTLFPERPLFYDTYRMMSLTDHRLYTDKLSVGIVDLTRIDLATAEDRRYNIDRWARLFKSQTWEDIKMLAKQDIDIHEAAETVWQLTRDERVQQLVWAREDYERRQRGRQLYTEKLNRQLSEKTQELSEKTQELSEKEQRLTETTQELSEKEQRLTETTQELSEKEQRLTETTQELSEKTQELSEAQRKISDQRQQLLDQQQLIADLQAQLATSLH